MEKDILDKNIFERAIQGEIILCSSIGVDLLEENIRRTQEEIFETQKQMGEAAERDDDLRENQEFLSLRTKLQTTLPRQMLNLLQLKSKTRVYAEPQDQKIRFASRVKALITFPDGRKLEQKFLLLGPIEAGTAILPGFRTISYTSPIGAALWGADPSNPISYDLRNNEVVYVKAELIG